MSRGLGLMVSAGVMACAGCASDPTQGYSFRSTYGESIRTVAVPVFENRTYAKGIEVALTEAVIKEIQRSTPWAVVPREQADSVLAGSITDSSLRALSTSRRTGLVQEMAVKLTVDFDWTSSRTGQVLVSRRAFDAVETFVPARGTGERLELGEAAAVQEMARDIVAELRSNW